MVQRVGWVVLEQQARRNRILKEQRQRAEGQVPVVGARCIDQMRIRCSSKPLGVPLKAPQVQQAMT